MQTFVFCSSFLIFYRQQILLLVLLNMSASQKVTLSRSLAVKYLHHHVFLDLWRYVINKKKKTIIL